MGNADHDKAVDFPADLRASVAETYERLWPAINDGRWRDAAGPAREILEALRKYQDADLPTPVRKEMAWSYFALGVEAKEAGRLSEALSLLQRATDVLPGQWWPSATARALWVQSSVHEDLGNFGAAIAVLRRLLDLLGNEPQRAGPVWFAIGCNHERRGEREEAIVAYSEALEQSAVLRRSESGDWRHKARAAIVRCQIGQGGPTPTFWDLWWRAGWVSRLVFVVVALTTAALFALSISAVSDSDHVSARSWLMLFGALMLVLLLPTLRRVSGHGFAVELQDRSHVTFAIDLGQAEPGLDVPPT